MPPLDVPSLIKQRVGLLGGSFNPAHEGHLHISEIALERLNLDRVWWLVSPQNPLKPTAGMAPFADRMASAEDVTAGNPLIEVSDFEQRIGARRTLNSLRALKRKFHGCDFVWLMGADNLAQAHRWHGWKSIFGLVPIAVFARPNYSLKVLSAPAAKIFANRRISEARAGGLAAMKPPAWTYLQIPVHSASSTEIRAEQNTTA